MNRASAESRARRAQQMTLVYAVMACLAVVVVLQFLLLGVAVEGYLGGRRGVLLPSTLASGVCLALALRLIRYVGPAQSRERSGRPIE
jgi:hypothetical protein